MLAILAMGGLRALFMIPLSIKAYVDLLVEALIVISGVVYGLRVFIGRGVERFREALRMISSVFLYIKHFHYEHHHKQEYLCSRKIVIPTESSCWPPSLRSEIHSIYVCCKDDDNIGT